MIRLLIGSALVCCLAAGCGTLAQDDDMGSTDSMLDAGDSDADTGDSNLLLIDDCDDGDNENELGGMWLSYDDGHDPGVGESTVEPESWFKDGTFTMSEPGEGDTGYAARIVGTTATKLGYDYVGLISSLGPNSYCPDPQPAEIDVASYTGLQFSIKGAVQGGRLVVKILHSKEGTEDNCTDNGLTGNTLTSWNDYAVNITDQLTEEWSTVRVNFRKDFVGPSTVSIEEVLAHAKDVHFFFQTTKGGTVDLTVDNLALYRDDSEDNDTEEPKDMVIHEADPPAENIPDDLDVDHPLQAAAEAYLDKGYNLTNWLEQYDFDDFGNYDETFVENLAAAGFKGLRLPIDLDRFIANRDAYFNDGETLEINPDLFTVLDAFDEWTEASGISLTVDYHQYDQSLDLDDELCVAAAETLWTAVADHFKDNPRPDLFFEILNEVEQSGGTGTVAATAYTPFAQTLIGAIRSADATRPIIFGDVEWYGIDALKRREPFDDENIIYAFHFYEPFIFTHQGTSWTELGPAHDIPYPYSAERWSTSYAAFGIDPAVQPSWIMSQINNYYRNGNQTALLNRMAEAKQWAIDNNVPLICNEFGAYDGDSEKADRIAYYQDLVENFETLRIPWQHWFMIMNASTGTVDPDLSAAFGLE